ncbi:MFS transporter [Streptomyces albus subsp. chlorinus]|uniref:MFS transporter n=1 Tax=Streptomyces albus TaxID=1888 RepID=UPI001D64EF44|nr:MFS transporter [Streptomyces albus]NSC25721.1 MFS transporter [Streptomyces albus subsp. chlorinus]
MSRPFSKYGPLSWVLASTVAGSLSMYILAFTLPWFVLQATGSAGRAGLIVFAQLVPLLLARLFMGPVVDRVGLRKVAVTGSLIETVSVGTMALLAATDRITYPVLVGLVAVLGAASGAGVLAKSFLAPSAARYVGLTESRGISMNATAMTVGQVAGPLIGAVLAAVNAAVGMGIVAVLCFTSSMIIVRLPSGMEPGAQQQKQEGYWKSLTGGVLYFGRDKLLVRMYVTLALLGLLMSPMSGVVLPLWAKQSGSGPEIIGVLTAIAACAGLVGSLVAIHVTEKVRPSLVLMVGYLLCMPQLLVMALGVPLWGVVAVWVVAGFAGAFLPPVTERITYHYPAPEFRSRVRSLGSSVVYLGNAVGNLVVGLAVDRFGLTAPLLGAAVVYVGVLFWFLSKPDVRRLTPDIRTPDIRTAEEPKGGGR